MSYGRLGDGLIHTDLPCANMRFLSACALPWQSSGRRWRRREKS